MQSTIIIGWGRSTATGSHWNNPLERPADMRPEHHVSRKEEPVHEGAAIENRPGSQRLVHAHEDDARRVEELEVIPVARDNLILLLIGINSRHLEPPHAVTSCPFVMGGRPARQEREDPAREYHCV